ncbi:hypothetical protein EAO71_01750 [Streptomyces sp. ms191]|nr:hypothetical protein EAO71_01750 [Streptomyces sp. ms191]
MRGATPGRLLTTHQCSLLPVRNADTDGAQPWLATAYVPGPSLADSVVAHGALPVSEVASAA